MTITVKFFSLIREAVETEQLVLELNEKLTTVEALNELGLRGGGREEALSHPNLIQAVNQRVVFQEEGINDGDEVAFFPPMTVDDVLVHVTEEAIDPGDLATRFYSRHPDAAVATFVGFVRDFNDEGQVDSLFLECYVEMATRVLNDLGKQHRSVLVFGHGKSCIGLARWKLKTPLFLSLPAPITVERRSPPASLSWIRSRQMRLFGSESIPAMNANGLQSSRDKDRRERWSTEGLDQ